MTVGDITPTLTHINTVPLPICHSKQIQGARLWNLPIRGLMDILCSSVCCVYTSMNVLNDSQWVCSPTHCFCSQGSLLFKWVYYCDNAAWPTWPHSWPHPLFI